MANKDFQPILTELRQQDWDVQQTTRGHWKATPPDRSKPLVHFSMSDDHHALKNTLKDLQRSGFMWPPPSKRDLRDAKREDAPVSQPDLTFEPVQPAPAAQPSETPEERMDRLFHELKEAKGYLKLADEHLAECQRKLEEAQQALQVAQIERDVAAERAKKTKEAFDLAYESAA